MKSMAYLLIFFGALILACAARAEESNMALETELFATLKTFAMQHSLPQSDLLKMLGKFILEGKEWKKGGIGAIGHDIFITVDGSRNALKISGRMWKGKESSKQEIVLTDGQRVLDSLDGVDLSKIIIVLFSPSEVRFIDLSNASGGKFLRKINP